MLFCIGTKLVHFPVKEYTTNPHINNNFEVEDIQVDNIENI